MSGVRSTRNTGSIGSRWKLKFFPASLAPRRWWHSNDWRRRCEWARPWTPYQAISKYKEMFDVTRPSSHHLRCQGPERRRPRHAARFFHPLNLWIKNDESDFITLLCLRAGGQAKNITTACKVIANKLRGKGRRKRIRQRSPGDQKHAWAKKMIESRIVPFPIPPPNHIPPHHIPPSSQKSSCPRVGKKKRWKSPGKNQKKKEKKRKGTAPVAFGLTELSLLLAIIINVHTA